MDIAALWRGDAVHRAAYTDPAVFALEQERIFRRAWLYVAHESEVPRAGDYVLRRLGPDEVLLVRGARVDDYCVLRCKSPAIPNTIAALLLYIRDRTQKIPHVYFGWTEGNPVTYLLKFLAFGEGDTAPVTREVLRQAEANPNRRPRVHVG